MSEKKTKLTAHEMELLKQAIPYAQELGEVPSRDDLREKLGCGDRVAKHIQEYLTDTEAIKIANRLQKLPESLENRSVIQAALGGEEAGGSLTSYLVRENLKLGKAIAKLRHEKTKKATETSVLMQEEIAALKEEFKAIAPVRKRSKPVPPSGLMLEVGLFDLHFGKQAWPAETGGRPYDVKITEATFFRALEALIERSRGFSYEKVLFIVGNDLLHSNDSEHRTANDTILDGDGRAQKAYIIARKAMVAAIEMLKELGPVEVVVCVGNHDRFSGWALGDSLECYFHNDEAVVVKNSPALRKYVEWGKVGLLFTHGDLGKRDDFPLLFATEQPELFGRTKFREVHTGHIHTTTTQEFHGVRVRTLASLSTADSYHASNGYVGSLRTAESYVWSKEEGLIAHYFYTDDAFPAIITTREIVSGS